ncbi:hypothetical protein EBR57_02215 [bacterium]|nr:hypothetical protein [bacterium]
MRDLNGLKSLKRWPFFLYVNRFSSMRNSLRAQRELLNNKQIRTTALAQLQSTKKEIRGTVTENRTLF